MKHYLIATGLLFVAINSAFAAEEVLAQRHIGRGSTCHSCHTTTPPSNDVKLETCLKCHGPSYADLAKKTEDLDINPHATHLGEVSCMQCHQGHKPPRLVCVQCHEFGDMFKVP